MPTAKSTTQIEPRRGHTPDAEDYLHRIGERVRLQRARRGMSRRVLAQSSGVSERYLAELERGSGNASLLVLRQIAHALSIRISDLVSSDVDPPLDLTLALHQLERLSPDELQEARSWITGRFGRTTDQESRVALIGLRGAGKTTLGRKAADTLDVPFIELDREIERSSGSDLAEIFARYGQAGFRRLEHERLETAVRSTDRAVIATGGSLVTEPATFELLRSTCFVVWLKADPKDHMERVVAQGDWRPMESSKQAMADLRAILSSRSSLYAQADAVIDTSAVDEATAVARLVEIVRTRLPQQSLPAAADALG
jgi:XRE family aerobic/anaerobic benzoate catabolism transcriptional regulator